MEERSVGAYCCWFQRGTSQGGGKVGLIQSYEVRLYIYMRIERTPPKFC